MLGFSTSAWVAECGRKYFYITTRVHSGHGFPDPYLGWCCGGWRRRLTESGARSVYTNESNKYNNCILDTCIPHHSPRLGIEPSLISSHRVLGYVISICILDGSKPSPRCIKGYLHFPPFVFALPGPCPDLPPDGQAEDAVPSRTFPLPRASSIGWQQQGMLQSFLGSG